MLYLRFTGFAREIYGLIGAFRNQRGAFRAPRIPQKGDGPDRVRLDAFNGTVDSFEGLIRGLEFRILSNSASRSEEGKWVGGSIATQENGCGSHGMPDGQFFDIMKSSGASIVACSSSGSLVGSLQLRSGKLITSHGHHDKNLLG